MAKHYLRPFMPFPGTLLAQGRVQNMAIFGVKSSFYGRLVTEWGIPSGKSLVRHIISEYIAKHY